MGADLKDFLDDFRFYGRRRMFGDAGFPPQYFLTFQWRTANAFDPFFHPGF
jgi:hypothetical protein